MFKSQAQKAKIAALESEGKVPRGTFNEWDSKTPNKPLPKYVKDSKSEPHAMLKRGMMGLKK